MLKQVLIAALLVTVGALSAADEKITPKAEKSTEATVTPAKAKDATTTEDAKAKSGDKKSDKKDDKKDEARKPADKKDEAVTPAAEEAKTPPATKQ